MIIRVDPDTIKEFNLSRSKAYISFRTRWIFWDRFDSMINIHSIKPEDVVLDLGFGSGMFLPTLSLYAKHVYGVDRKIDDGTKKMLKDYSRNNVTLTKQDIRNRLPFDDNTFDVIYCADVLEHLAEIDDVIKDVRRILKPDGFFIVSNPSSSLLYRFLSFFTGFKKSSLKEKHILSSEDVEKKIESHRGMDEGFRHFIFQEKRSVPLLIPLFNIIKYKYG